MWHWTGLCRYSNTMLVSQLSCCHTISLRHQKTNWSLNYPKFLCGSVQQCSTNPQWQEVHAAKSETHIKTHCSTLNPSKTLLVLSCLFKNDSWSLAMTCGGHWSARWGLTRPATHFPSDTLPKSILPFQSSDFSVTESSGGKRWSELLLARRLYRVWPIISCMMRAAVTWNMQWKPVWPCHFPPDSCLGVSVKWGKKGVEEEELWSCSTIRRALLKKHTGS